MLGKQSVNFGYIYINLVFYLVLATLLFALASQNDAALDTWSAYKLALPPSWGFPCSIHGRYRKGWPQVLVYRKDTNIQTNLPGKHVSFLCCHLGGPLDLDTGGVVQRIGYKLFYLQERDTNIQTHLSTGHILLFSQRRINTISSSLPLSNLLRKIKIALDSERTFLQP